MSDVLARLAPALADRYRIEREIGAGGMATVYLAHDLKHDRDVALKVLRPELAAVLGAERFLNEIRISAQLDHPYILTLIDSGEADGFLYYVMPFVRGESLRQRLDREKQLGVDEALTITRQVGSALEYAHRRGVVHRDIKPENILLHEGEATLADFGIAMAVKEAGGNRLTETGLSLGTPQYMSPEQATGDRSLDARSDVYSLAAVLYEMLAGEPPHSGATVQAVIAKLMTERPTRLRVMRDTVPEGVDNAVAKALAKVPADRYPDAGEFARALATASRPVESTERPKWLPVALAAVVAIVVITGAVLALLSSRQKPVLPAPERVQLTTTGNATWPSLSPDANRIAFAEKQCDADFVCTWQLVIQDIDGTGRLVVTRGAAGLGDTQWTRDGRSIVYNGSYGSARWGVFAVSSLGGSPRYLGCCSGWVLTGDTVAVSPQVAPGDSIAIVRLVTVRDGQPHDSLPIRKPGIATFAWGTDDPAHMLTMVQDPGLGPVELRLVDRKGAVLSRSTAGMDMRGRQWTTGWLSGQNALLVGVPRERSSNAFDFFRVRIEGTRIVSRTDTVMRGVELSPGIDIAADGSRMVFSAGPFERTVMVFETAARGLSPVRELMTSTGDVWGRISPDGRKIAMTRPVNAGTSRRDQLWLTSIDGTQPVQLTGPLEELIDFEWNPDGSGLIYVNARSATDRIVITVDTTGSRARELGRFGTEIAEGVQVLPGGRFILAAPTVSSLTLFTADGRKQASLAVPRWFGRADRFSGSPDGRHVAVMGWDRAFDSAIVARMDLGTGLFTRLATLPGESHGRIKWSRDGDLVFDIVESRGVHSLFRVKADGTQLRRVAILPRMVGSYTVADDGRRIVAFTDSEKSDVYMIRNLGEILRR